MPIRILLADDHAIFRSGLRALLERERDFEIVGETGDGPETVRAVSKLKPDVLMLDLSMPGLPGAKVAESVAADHPSVAILVLTMHEDEHYLLELFRVGARGFVLKRSSDRELVLAIRRLHSGGRYVDPSLAGSVLSSLVTGDAGARKSASLGGLTQREREVCKLLAYGHTNAEIADKLCLSHRTIETHRANIMAKLGMKGRAELVRFAIESGLLKVD